MPSKAEIQAEREAEARRVAARARLDGDVRSALADGLPADEVAKIVARALREGGMLASADHVVTAGRSPRRK
jgi:predicted methyltransferase